MVGKVMDEKNDRSNPVQVNTIILPSTYTNMTIPVKVTSPAKHQQGYGGQVVDEHLKEILIKFITNHVKD